MLGIENTIVKTNTFSALMALILPGNYNIVDKDPGRRSTNLRAPLRDVIT